MKHIIPITASIITLSAIAFAAASAVCTRNARRKPVMTFKDLYLDNRPHK
ncbi:MAG: hypothetical protein K2N38_13835 [Oscillospiraceae bacterium]|nr:hypothetical protein [Oscillospiraceae bacterium]